MTDRFPDKTIEETTDSVKNLKNSLIEEYLELCGTKETIKLECYDLPSSTAEQWSDKSYEEATEYANEILLEVFKSLHINSISQ